MIVGWASDKVKRVDEVIAALRLSFDVGGDSEFSVVLLIKVCIC